MKTRIKSISCFAVALIALGYGYTQQMKKETPTNMLLLKNVEALTQTGDDEQEYSNSDIMKGAHLSSEDCEITVVNVGVPIIVNGIKIPVGGEYNKKGSKMKCVTSIVDIIYGNSCNTTKQTPCKES